ncbi:endonuclease/exonuclease/phosphatase family protein [Anaeromicropila herbilytica]|uniref:Endonuclease/exonuclease/phosphatase domain-containing protein n=1 Tax=Anaeromicropila herbilytica TaxID=2785025 RepID=A0A7R7EKV2_9FIRM|nr:endonuclease/exonuclease/phosphatase family protein [Anaeromicropila herbilytica]BCN30746.1 hypothetical protein bsdtb5_20410 [Anaeromicropila herbilytica]
MRIATYNIWNSESGVPARNEYLINEIKKTSADIICLQEVKNIQQAKSIAQQVQYNFMFFDTYNHTDEGLCILSQFPFHQQVSLLRTINMIYSSVLVEEKIIGIVNLHLPWDSTISREKQIVSTISQLEKEKWDYTFMMGDFNCSDNSDVQRYLLGECTLYNSEVNPCFYDLADTYAEITNTKVESTLNFRENPRFQKNSIEKNQRFDRILLRNPYPVEFPVLNNCYVWGKQVYENIALAASDHYGILIDIKFD